MKRMLSRVEARPPDTSPHPATFTRSEDAVSGADKVSADLDLFNLKYQRLCEDIRERLQQLGDQHPDDPEIQVSCHHDSDKH